MVLWTELLGLPRVLISIGVVDLGLRCVSVLTVLTWWCGLLCCDLTALISECAAVLPVSVIGYGVISVSVMVASAVVS